MRADRNLIDTISLISGGLEMGVEKFAKRRKKAVEMLAPKQAALQTYLEIFPSSKTIDLLDSLSTLPYPVTRQINILPEGSLFHQNNTVSGYLQISRNETLKYQDSTLKEEPRLILDGLSDGIKTHPSIAEKIFNLEKTSGNEILPSLCAAISRHGFLIYIPENFHVSKPLVIDLEADTFFGHFAPLYFFMLIEENASADVFINFHGQKSDNAASFFAIQFEGYLNHSSKLNLFEVQKITSQTDLALNEAFKISENASLNYLAFDSGGLFVERRLRVNFEEEHGSAQITGLYKPGKQSTYHYSTSQDHNASYTKSDLLYKGVLGGEAKVNWDGNIFVKQDTKGVDGYQRNSNLLTSKKVQVNSIPGLEILTDDVRCSHGVTISDIDEGQRLYLQSRGISRKESERLIIDGFFNNAFERIEASNLRGIIKREFPGSMDADL